MRLTNFHILISSVAAIAGVAIAAYQTFMPPQAGQPPVNVVVSLDPQKADAAVPDTIVEKSDAPSLATSAVNLAERASFTAALKDGSENRYSFGTLFDGHDDTFISIAKPDEELNILVTFEGQASHTVTALEYVPPAGVDPRHLARTVDVMVLPDGQLEASGRPVISFSLPQSGESRTFAIPGRAQGRGLWLRVAGEPGADRSFVGDFRILSETVAP